MWPAYVINLAANVARMEASAAVLDAQGIKWQRIEGVNGWRLSPDEIARVYDTRRNLIRAKRPLVAPEIGCYLSHIAAWRTIADGPADGAFVFEDDFAADPALADVLGLLSEDHEDWDLVKLFARRIPPLLGASRPLGGRHSLGRPWRVPNGTIAYGVTRSAAARLADRAIPFFRPVDEDHKFFWERNLRVSVVLPQPVIKTIQPASTGTVSDARQSAARANRNSLAQGLRSLNYLLQYEVLVRYHRLIGTAR